VGTFIFFKSPVFFRMFTKNCYNWLIFHGIIQKKMEGGTFGTLCLGTFHGIYFSVTAIMVTYSMQIFNMHSKLLVASLISHSAQVEFSEMQKKIEKSVESVMGR